MQNTFQTVLSQSALAVAPRLLGSYLVRQVDGQQIIGKIVETEAYDQTDAASHSYRGQTPRTAVMFGPAGYLYVYFTYGMHYCCNMVVGDEGSGQAVLIRALEPLEGQAAMRALTNGPAKLCKSLQIDAALNGHNLLEPPLQLLIKPPIAAPDIVQTTRIGISRAQDAPYRFYIRGNAYVSKPAARQS